MALISEETCGNCMYHKRDGDGTFWCGNPMSPDHMEDVTWDHSCDYYEVYEDDPTMSNM